MNYRESRERKQCSEFCELFIKKNNERLRGKKMPFFFLKNKIVNQS